jgi:hypothetical protein
VVIDVGKVPRMRDEKLRITKLAFVRN